MPGEQNTTNAKRRMESSWLPCMPAGGAGLLAALGALVDARKQRSRHHRASHEFQGWRASS